MPLTAHQYNLIMREYDEDRMNALREADKRREYVNTNIAGFKELSDRAASLSLEYTKKALRGEREALKELPSMLGEINDKKAGLLIANGLPADYLEPVYKCGICKDTGYKDGVKCRCFKQKEISYLFDISGMSKILEGSDFDKMSDRYYSGDDLDHFRESKQRSISFVNNFGSDYQNLLFYGTVGTGKSLMSACIADKLLRSGRSVLYFSASSLFDELAGATFNRGSDRDNGSDQSSAADLIYGCDLLIIDDLGTEMTNNFTVSELFSLLNDRFLHKRSVIISTNLSLEELKNRYSDRIFSRLVGGFEFCRLSGPDIRLANRLITNR